MKPGGLVVLHTDKDLPAARLAASRQGFDQLLDGSTHIAPLLKAREPLRDHPGSAGQ
jgi:hypothetical protein